MSVTSLVLALAPLAADVFVHVHPVKFTANAKMHIIFVSPLMLNDKFTFLITLIHFPFLFLENKEVRHSK